MLLKVLVGCLLCGALFQDGGGAQHARDLKALYDAHAWFELREALANTSAAPPLYRGAVAAAFNEVAEAEAALKPLYESNSDSDAGPVDADQADADQASEWLSYMYLRSGQYRKAAAQLEDNSPLTAMLRGLPDQAVTRFQPCTVHCRRCERKLFIPVSIQGKSAEFMVDSDANFSFMSESEAKNLGLTVRDSNASVHGATGKQTAFRTAVADAVDIGNLQLRNVTFMVLGDNEEVFSSLPLSQKGAIGLPVLLAFRTVRFSTGGTFEIGVPSAQIKKHPTLCFDGADPVALVEFKQQRLPVIFDTGAEATELWPPFAKQFSDIVNASVKTSTKTERSFGGKSEITEKVVPEMMLRVGGFDAHLHPAHVLLGETTPNSRWYYARLGLDVLNLAHQVTIDFEALTLTLQ